MHIRFEFIPTKNALKYYTNKKRYDLEINHWPIWIWHSVGKSIDISFFTLIYLNQKIKSKASIIKNRFEFYHLRNKSIFTLLILSNKNRYDLEINHWLISFSKMKIVSKEGRKERSEKRILAKI